MKKSSNFQTHVSVMLKQSNLRTPVLGSEKQSMRSYWVQKNLEVFKEDFSNLSIVSRLFVFNEWKEIAKALERVFNTKIIINPLFADLALIKFDKGRLEELIENKENGKNMVPSTCYLKNGIGPFIVDQ